MTEITVSTTDQLFTAMASAKGGDTIVLASGFSGDLSLGTWQGIDITYDAPLTIRSADPSRPAVFSQLTVSGASNIVFQDVKFDYTFNAGDPEWTRSVDVSDSSNISFVNCTFDGDVAQGVSAAQDGFSYGEAIVFLNSTNVTIRDSDISGYANGAAFSNCDGVTFVNNEVHNIRADGLKLWDVKGVLVEGNSFHDFRPSMAGGDHPDMIQMHSSGATEASRDIIIRANVFDIGEGSWTQTVFMGNEAAGDGAGTAMYYSNILIENNTITNAHTHGIIVGETNGLIIRNNTVVHADGGLVDGADGGVEIPGIQVMPTSTGVQILQNITGAISGYTGQTGWTVANNVIAQDQNPTAANWYGALFDPASLVATNGQHLFRALPGGVIDQLNAGSSLTQGVGSGTPQAPAPVPAPAPAELELDTGVQEIGPSAADLIFGRLGSWSNFNGDLSEFDILDQADEFSEASYDGASTSTAGVSAGGDLSVTRSFDDGSLSDTIWHSKCAALWDHFG